ncbi:Unconventional myosin-IXa [Orchesella cincta]|uniref:Unconventional myosin-IXa n=1 Tax=Orchesella cincta TaxID=48709 RepID=A0A1D2MWK1_ORCCI|nr:Unconventional myosin-IXa [Orchesella cincta]
MEDDHARHIVRVYVGSLSQEYEALSVEASKHTTAEEIVQCIVQKLGFKNATDYELAEVIGNSTGQECKERRIGPYESPVALKLLWPKASEAADSILFTGAPPASSAASSSSSTTTATSRTGASSAATTTSSSSHFSSTLPSSFTSNLPNAASSYHPQQQQQHHNTSTTSNNSTSDVASLITDQYRFCLRERLTDSLWSESFVMDPQIIRDYFYRFLYQSKDKEYPDLCQLPDLNELTLLENLKSRFNTGHIYTYVGSILIAINPFRFHPIYNPKYVKLYQNRRREELPPHIFAIADSAYHTMLKAKRNQCIVISGESGSGKTESTNFLLHHLTALSQKGSHGSGVEQTILSAGPVLEVKCFFLSYFEFIQFKLMYF